ncbi:MAG: hypothetical protein PCFJNLEI_03200 [Verrucomicrobiae bacterium]|nr:hypothetical protein [Verrucomicrobiae bacterium]
MKPSILIVMLDFLVCSLLMFVVGTGGDQTTSATSATPAVHAEFSPAALQSQQSEWNRAYEQDALLTQLQAETTAKEQLQARLSETTTAAQRLAEEKARVEQAKAQTEKELAGVETQLGRVAAEREKLAKEGEATKESLARLQTEQQQLQQQKVELEQHAAQLGKTVVSQQAVITTLSEEVRTSQTRVETQLSDVALGQQQLAATLTRLDEFSRTLPAVLQTSVAEVRKEQEVTQQNAAALAEDVKTLTAALNAEERAKLLQAVADVAKGQQGLQSQLDTLLKSGTGGQVGESLTTILAGQDALRQQTAKLGDQIESIKARGPGPFKAVQGARLAVQVNLATRDPREATTASFQAAAYPPVITVEGRAYIVATARTLGLAWHAAGDPANELTDFIFMLSRTGETPWAGVLTSAACVLRANPVVAAVELAQTIPGLTVMELAGPDAVLQQDQRKLNIFKSTATGLSFEVEVSPDLADARYVVIKRTLRGPATWFENPAYRADTGDYLVTADGKLVGIMVNRDRAFIITAANVQDCLLTASLADRKEFQAAAQRYSRLK